MNKKELIDEIAAATEMSKKESKEVLDSLLGVFEKTLSKGEDISLVGFGNFKVADRKAKNGVNPKTGEKITIPAKKVVKFKAGKDLSDSVQ